ncbi:MAG TPA: hypothetical protein VMX79_01835 [bacterium]|nr:hypothetical protein [bacterium]
MAKDEGNLVLFQILPDDEKAAEELAEKAGISVADLVLLALRYCLRAKGAAPFRELLTKGGVSAPGSPEITIEVESEHFK